MCLPWPVLYRPLHDALIEECSTEPNTLSPAVGFPAEDRRRLIHTAALVGVAVVSSGRRCSWVPAWSSF
jgi:hypothetical protein